MKNADGFMRAKAAASGFVSRRNGLGGIDESPQAYKDIETVIEKQEAWAIVEKEPELETVVYRPGMTMAEVEKALERVGARGADRRARFRTVALVAWPDGAELTGEYPFPTSDHCPVCYIDIAIG